MILLNYNMYGCIDVENSGSESSTFPVKRNCFNTGCTSSSTSTDVVHQADGEGRLLYDGRSLTSPFPEVDLLGITGSAISDSELTKLPVNLKLNGVVQLDEGPLDLSVSRRVTATRCRRSAADNKPEVISTSPRLRSSKSQTLTSGSLARLVKRFGGTSTSTTTSSVIGSDGAGRSNSGVCRGASTSHESSARPRSVTVPQSTSLFKPLPTPSGGLITSSERPPTTFVSAPPSRWRRDSFWANGGWLSGATGASSSSTLTTERLDNRKRSQPAATSDSVDRRSHVADAQSIKLNRKQFTDHRKSSHRGSTRLRCERKLSSSASRLDSSSRALKVSPPRPQEKKALSCVDSDVKHATPTSPKLARIDDCRDTAKLTTELADSEKKTRQDSNGGDVTATTPKPMRSNLTSLRCGTCGSQFDSLYCLTVHLEESGHKPASDVAVLPTPSPATSPSSTDGKPTVASPAMSASTPPMSAPQRLVRGQDVWLARGVEQTDRILRCIQCNAPARSLAELTLHMVHTKHYINIVGPTTSTTDMHQRVLPPPTTLRDKPTDSVALKAKNGLRTASSKEHHALVNTKTRVVDDDQRILQQRSVLPQGCDVQGHDTKNKTVNKDGDKNTKLAQHARVVDCSGAAESRDVDAMVDGKMRTADRGAAFSVRNLIAGDVDGNSTSHSSALSASAFRLPLATPSSSPRSRRHDGRCMTSSVGPEVTSSSDERRSPVTVAESLSGHDVISA